MKKNKIDLFLYDAEGKPIRELALPLFGDYHRRLAFEVNALSLPTKTKFRFCRSQANRSEPFSHPKGTKGRTIITQFYLVNKNNSGSTMAAP